VPFLHLESGRIEHVPLSDLPPGAVRAQVDGIDGVVWLRPELLKQGEIRHPPFSEEIRDYLRRIQGAFAEHRPLTLADWEDGFRRDANPEREIALWLHAGDVYTDFARGEPSAERRRDLYRCVVTCLTTGPDAALEVFRPETLTRVEAERVVRRFFGGSA
jgi:hypothetical protein